MFSVLGSDVTDAKYADTYTTVLFLSRWISWF